MSDEIELANQKALAYLRELAEECIKMSASYEIPWSGMYSSNDILRAYKAGALEEREEIISYIEHRFGQDGHFDLLMLASLKQRLAGEK